jgi:5'-3' exonuclease
MGISDFLYRVLESAGRPCDLQTYAEGIVEKVEDTHKRRRRPMRIGIDVSSWIYNAAHGFGDMLGDERHLTNYGRAALYDEQQQQQRNNENEQHTASLNPSEETIQQYVEKCTKYVLDRMEVLRDMTKAHILIVLDGASPPIKTREVGRRRELRREQERVREQPVDPNESPTKNNERRTKAFRRAGAGRYHTRIVDELLNGLRQAQLAFVVAPYEADSELAFLANTGYIDLVVTEDSDLVAHGAKAILYKFPRGKLLRFSDIGASSWNLSDFTPVMMTILFVSVGCDYCDKLKGIGLLTASRVIREAFCTPHKASHGHRGSPSKLSRVFEELYTRCRMDSTTLTPQFKREYEERFIGAIFMYRHPVVYDPIQENNFLMSRCLYEQELEEGHASVASSSVQEDMNSLNIYIDADLLDHGPYVELCEDFGRIQDIVGKLHSKTVAMKAAQGLKEDDDYQDTALPPEAAKQVEEVTTTASPMQEAAEVEVVEIVEAVVPQDQPEPDGSQYGDFAEPGESSQILTTQEEIVIVAQGIDNDKENREEGPTSTENQAEGKETSDQEEMSEEEFLGTQPFTSGEQSPPVKPSSRRLDDEFRATENQPSTAEQDQGEQSEDGSIPTKSKTASPNTGAVSPLILPVARSPVTRDEEEEDYEEPYDEGYDV